MLVLANDCWAVTERVLELYSRALFVFIRRGNYYDYYTICRRQSANRKLKSRNLTFKNIDYARKYLELYGYSNLIKSYRDPYVIEENGKKIFRDGVSFEQVCSLYIFDKIYVSL